jgi:DNA-binding CsgD family transcriptional regulator
MPPSLRLVPSGANPQLTSSWNLLAPCSEPAVLDPPAHIHQTLWDAAVEAEDRGSTGCPLDDAWQDHMRGRLSVWWESVGPNRILLLSRVAAGCGVTSEDADILARVLSGEQQKVVACDLGIAPSTISGRYVRALDKLDLTPSTVPVPLVLAAQARVGVGRVPAARSAIFESHGRVCKVISVPRPNTAAMTSLTPAEQEVAAWIIEGCSRFEVARRRKTSVHTVARQFHAVFEGERVTGRHALIRRAVALGCFEGEGATVRAGREGAESRRRSRRNEYGRGQGARLALPSS